MRDHDAFWLIDGDAGKARRPTVYRHLAHLLKDHPDLRPLHEERSCAALVRVLDHKRIDRARAAWEAALADRRIRFETGNPSLGFAGHSVPDPLDPGHDPIDDQKYASPQEMEDEHR